MIILQDLWDAAEASVVAPLNAQINSLQTQLTQAQADRDAAIAALGPLNSQITALTAQVTDLQNQIITLDATIVSLNAQIAALQTQLNSAPVPSTWNTGTRGSLPTTTVTSPVTGDNVLIENQSFTVTSLVVTGANFTLRNCKVTYSGAIGVDCQGANPAIVDCVFVPTTGNGKAAKLAGLFQRNKIDINTSGAGSVELTGVSTVRDNYWFDKTTGFNSVVGVTSGSTIVNNTVV